MALTPADVHNVVFNHPPIGKRGYDENEVDQFLDLIEDTLAEMQDENADLQAQLAKGNTGNPSSDSSVSDDTIQKYEDQIADLEAKLEASQETADTKIKQLQSDLKSAQSSGAKGDSSSTEASAQSTRVLALAQETADRLAAEAQHDADETRSGAQQEKAAVIADAKSQAEATLKAAQDNAQALQQDAERKHDEIMTSVHNQQSVLEARIAKLQTYEREYRTRMKTFLESQLEELESRDDEPSQDS